MMVIGTLLYLFALIEGVRNISWSGCPYQIGVWETVFACFALPLWIQKVVVRGLVRTSNNNDDDEMDTKICCVTCADMLVNLTSLFLFCWTMYGTHLALTQPFETCAREAVVFECLMQANAMAFTPLPCTYHQWHTFYVIVLTSFCIYMIVIGTLFLFGCCMACVTWRKEARND